MPVILRFLGGFASSGTTVGVCIGSGSNTLLASAAAFAAASASATVFLFSALVVWGSSFCFPITLILIVPGGGSEFGGGSCGGGITAGSGAGFGNPLSDGGFTNLIAFFTGLAGVL